MLHNVELPNMTRRRLTEAMLWQFRLLSWAARAKVVNEDGCRGWLAAEARFATRAAAIAKWVCNAKTRYEPLVAFAADTSVEPEIKLQWLDDRLYETYRLLHIPRGQLEQIDYKAPQTPLWQKQAAEFWKAWYELFRSSGGLPACLFRHPPAQHYTAQEFLGAFLETNDMLCVCPVCDTTAYFTVVQRKTGRSIYTDIDHYLPKDSYPHLAIHPYNLIPLCHNCNSGVKGVEDPLNPKAKPSLRLEEIWLPYRIPGLRDSLLLSLSEQMAIREHPDAKEKRHEFVIDAFAIKPQHTLKQDPEVLTDLLKRVYGLPGRWQTRIDEIGEKLFRRMREYLRFYRLEREVESATIYLDELLYTLDQEDMAREPYTIAMTWWLAYLINAELSHKGNPLAQEIEEWHKQQFEHLAKMRAHGEQIRSLIAPPP
jgi:hypothetical protein